MMPLFLGPRQMIASSAFGSMKPMDMTPRLSSTYTGDQPAALWCTSWPSSPSMRGTLGPVMSTSSNPTWNPLPASANASWHATVLLPTPPLPESTSSLCFTPASRCFTSDTAVCDAIQGEHSHRNSDTISTHCIHAEGQTQMHTYQDRVSWRRPRRRAAGSGSRRSPPPSPRAPTRAPRSLDSGYWQKQ